MLEYELIHFRPSQLASAAMVLARMYTNDDVQGIRCALRGRKLRGDCVG